MTFKVDKIIKLSYLKRAKNDQWLHDNEMVFSFHEFGFYELLSLPIRIKSKVKIFLFWKGLGKTFQ